MWDCNTKPLSRISNNYIFMLGNSTVWHLRISCPPSRLNPDTFIGPLNVTWITVSHSSEQTLSDQFSPWFRNALLGESLGETWTLWAASYRHYKRQQSHLYTTRMLAATSAEYRKAQTKKMRLSIKKNNMARVFNKTLFSWRSKQNKVQKILCYYIQAIHITDI